MEEQPAGSSTIPELRALLREQRYDEALPLARLLAEQDPDSAEACLLLGVALFRTGDLTGAAEVLRKAASLDPNSRNAQHNLAAVLVQLGEIEEAVVLLDGLVRADPRDAGARVALATAEAKLLTSPPPARSGPDPGRLSARNLIAVLVRPYRFLIAQRGYTGLKAPIVFGLVCAVLTQIGNAAASASWILLLSPAGREKYDTTGLWEQMPLRWAFDAVHALAGTVLMAFMFRLVLRKPGCRAPWAATLRAVAYSLVPALVLGVPAAFLAADVSWGGLLAGPAWALAYLWGLGLLVAGIAVLHQIHWPKAFVAVVIAAVLVSLFWEVVGLVWLLVCRGPQALWSSDPVTQLIVRTYVGS